MTGTLILLAVMKTIGRILLGILAALLFFFLLALWVPVRYRIAGCLRDKEGGASLDPERAKKALQVELRISWLLHLVRLSVGWEEELSVNLGILFFRIPLGGQKKPKRQEPKAWQKPEPEKKKRTKPDAGKIVSLLGSEETKAAIHAILERSGRLIGSLLPKRWTLEGSAGFGGPEGTGILMETEGLLFPFLCGHVWITPEFGKYSADLSFSAKGSIQLIRLVLTAAALLADRNVRKLLREGRALTRKDT